MQCVGTLSWSVMGVAGLRKPSRRNPESQTSSWNAGLRDAGAAYQAAAENGCGEVAWEGKSAGVAARPVRGEAATLEMDSTQLVCRCMNGDSGAWAELVRLHHRRVYGLCYRFTGNPADAEDLTQDVFLKIYSNLASFNGSRGSLQVWITTLTRNLLVDHFRRTRNLRATGSLNEGWESSEELQPVDRLTSKLPSPHQTAARKELARMVQEALTQVPVELREAVILRDLQDMDYKEIAQVLGIPEGTVKSRISRGRAELARLLERNQHEVM
jgi:RNA polymerase sigma-70 factor (ECF subfamily)